MASTTKNLISSLKKQTQQFVPVASEMFIPNHSGDHSAGTVRTTPTASTDIVNKAYVDNAVASGGVSLDQVILASRIFN